MKVLLNTSDLNNPGGVANYYRSLRPHLSKEIDYFVIGTRADGEGRLRTIRRFLKDYLDFFKRLKQGSYDIVHLNPSFAPKAIVREGIFLLMAKAFRKKVIVFIRGWDLNFERLMREYFSFLFRFVYFKADAFIVLSSDFETKLIGMGFRKQIFRESTVVDDRIFGRIEEKSLTECRKERGPGFHILYLARIEKSKGVYLTLDTFRTLRERFPQIMMTIAGDGREAARAREYATKHRIDGVDFPGYLRNESKYLAFSQADVYFFPTSHGEGMPNSVLEAMAYGLPVVTRPVGGIPDFFEDGKMGFLTESLSCSVFAELIEKLIRDSSLRREMGNYNRAFVINHCMASTIAARLEDIYRKVLFSTMAG